MFIYNADDFGLTPGVNNAIFEACIHGGLTHASIMPNMNYFDDAVSKTKSLAQKLHVGIHLNFSVGRPISNVADVSLLVDAEGSFKYDYMGLLLYSFSRRKKAIKQQVALEIEAQIQKCIRAGLELSHIDSHRHVHTIPWINKIVQNLAHKYNIKRIRVINERFLFTFLSSPSYRILSPAGLTKYILLKINTLINRNQTTVYFYSIIHSCKIVESLLKKIVIPKKYQSIEIMFHPSYSEIDSERRVALRKEKKHLFSKYRILELEALLNIKKK